MRSKIAKAMKQSDASLSLIASNLLAGKYATKAELAKVKASVGNAMTNSENAFVALIQPASNGRKGLASIANEDFDCSVTEVAQTQIKAHILAKVIEAELEDLEDSEPSEYIDVVDFDTEGDETVGETEVEGYEPETEADSSELIDTEGSEEETEVEVYEFETEGSEEETEVEGYEPETEVEGEETEASEEDENEEIEEENFDDDLDLEFEAGDDLDLEEGDDDISNYFEDESEIKAAKKATTASKKRTTSNGLDDLFNFKDN